MRWTEWECTIELRWQWRNEGKWMKVPVRYLQQKWIRDNLDYDNHVMETEKDWRDIPTV